MQNRRMKRGFTLIELIAVMVILGILAAVAIPKYSDMTAEAEKGAANGYLAAGLSQVSMEYAKLAMSSATSGSDPTTIAMSAVASAAAGNYVGDTSYVVSYSGTGTAASGSVTVTVTFGDEQTISKTWSSAAPTTGT